MWTSDGSRFISILPAALKSVATLSLTARLSGSPIHLDDVAFNSHPVFHKWLVWVLLDFLMQWLEGFNCTKNSVCWWRQNCCIRNGQNLSVFVILKKTEVPCCASNVFCVCVCVYTHTHNTFSTDRLFSDTSNWCIYPLFLTFYSIKPSQPLHPPSCSHIFTSSKPSQNIYPLSYPHTCNCTKPSQPLHPPSYHHTVICTKPSQQLHPTSCCHTLNSSKSSQPLHSLSYPNRFNSFKPP
jgi:hypothetical protein